MINFILYASGIPFLYLFIKWVVPVGSWTARDRAQVLVLSIASWFGLLLAILAYLFHDNQWLDDKTDVKW